MAAQYAIVPTTQYVLKANSSFHVTLGGVTFTNFEGLDHEQVFDTCVVGPDVPASGEVAGYTSVYLAREGAILIAKRQDVVQRPVVAAKPVARATGARKPAGDTPCPKCHGTGEWSSNGTGTATKPCNVCDGLGTTSSARAAVHVERYGHLTTAVAAK